MPPNLPPWGFVLCVREPYFPSCVTILDTPQCEDIDIFLSVRFCVKSILVIVEPQKLPFWISLWHWNVIFVNFCNIHKDKMCPNRNSELVNLSKRRLLRLYIPEIWFHVKYEMQENLWNFHTVDPRRSVLCAYLPKIIPVWKP